MSSSSSDDSVENVEKTTLFILPSINGVPGRDGPAGPAGPAGATGASGPAGATGASGSAGVATSCLRSFVVPPQELALLGDNALTLTPGPLPNGSAECPCITLTSPTNVTVNVAPPFVVKIDGSVMVRIPPNIEPGQISINVIVPPFVSLITNVMNPVGSVPTTQIITFPFNISPILTTPCPTIIFDVFYPGDEGPIFTELSTITLEVLPASTPTCTACP